MAFSMSSLRETGKMRYDAELVFESYSSRDMVVIDTHFLSFKGLVDVLFHKKLYGKRGQIH